MSFNMNENGKTYAPGYFLAHEECRRETHTIPQTMATTAPNGGKYVKMGTMFPSNNGSAIGIVYEDVDVSSGDMPGSIVTAGVVYKNRLHTTPDASAISALTEITFINSEPSVSRPTPMGIDGELGSISVASAAGTAVGDTKITVTYAAKPADAVYYYKIATGTAASVSYGEVLDATWTAWDGTSDITAATDKKITIVAAINKAAYASGNATVTAKA